MPPKFTLQPVLDYRHNRVETLEIALGLLLNEQKEGQARLTILLNTQNRLFDDLHKQLYGEMDMFTIQQLRENVRRTNKRINLQHIYLAELNEKVEKQRDELIQAKQEEEMLVKLKSKELERFQEKQDAQEKLLQDDIYVTRAYQRRPMTELEG